MKRFKKILLYTGTEDNGAGIRRAIKLAQENGAQLSLIDVIKPMPPALGFKPSAKPEDVQQLIAQEHHEKLAELANKHADAGVSMRTIVRLGDPAVEIVRQVLQEGHDLVIKTADGISTVGRLFGSVARSLMRLCPCPVWVLKPEIHGELDIILAAVDLNTDEATHADLNSKILTIAASIAEREQTNLHVVCGWDLWMESSLRRHAGDDEIDTLIEDRKQKITQQMDRLFKDTGIDPERVTVHLKRGSPIRVIPLTVDRIEADLLVMGSVCRTGVAGFLIGNTAESILTDLTCSVLTLKPQGFHCPVEVTQPPADENRVEIRTSLP